MIFCAQDGAGNRKFRHHPGCFMQQQSTTIRSILTLPVLIAALGYFVDIYDLVLFSIVRVPSLRALGLQGKELIDQGVFLLNMQMAGMLVGGVIWGILGDRKGRLKIMFGSIFLYSIANLLNGSVSSLPAYAGLRFLAGIGLAGELGAGITLVTEVLHQSVRGYGTMIVASVGVSGAILANFVARYFDWRNAFFIGGGWGCFCSSPGSRLRNPACFGRWQPPRSAKGTSSPCSPIEKDSAATSIRF